jgi:hypothetical protein
MHLHFFTGSHRDSLNFRSKPRIRNENIVSAFRKNELEIAVDVGVGSQLDLLLRRDIAANKDACPGYGCADCIDNMADYLPGFGLLNLRLRGIHYKTRREREMSIKSDPPIFHACHLLMRGRLRVEIPAMRKFRVSRKKDVANRWPHKKRTDFLRRVVNRSI